jgi:hypothetical protein
VSEKTAALDQAIKFSKKCAGCGLRNFPGAERCSRCDAELSRNSQRVGAKAREYNFRPAHTRRSSKRKSLILLTTLVVLLGLVVFYVQQDLPGSRQAIDLISSAQNAPTSDAPLDPIAEAARSQESAKRAVAAVKHFGASTQPTMSFEDYDRMLSQLESDLNSSLPTLVSHSPSDEKLRQEVSGALRDYSAARNWWKTTIDYSHALSDADRVERLQVEWASAQTHLRNAETLLNQ